MNPDSLPRFKTFHLDVTFSPETIEKLEEIAARTGRTIQETISDALDNAIIRERDQDN